MIYLITFILAFCSIVYELLLAQTLSAFLENTVLRYSITIGLYLFSMGYGALITEKKIIKYPVITLLRVEILLTMIGGMVVILVHTFNLLFYYRSILMILSHLLIIIIGILTGMEIPLLIEMKNKERKNSENLVLGIDYFGAFIGTILFTFYFYRIAGLTKAAFMVGSLNALAGILLLSQYNKVPSEKIKKFQKAFIIQFVFCIIILLCLINSKIINEYFIIKYIG